MVRKPFIPLSPTFTRMQQQQQQQNRKIVTFVTWLGALKPDFFYNLSVPSLKVPSFLENFMHLQHLVTYSKNQYFVQEVLLCISFQIS